MANKRKRHFVRTFKARLGALLLHRSARRQHGLFDRACNFLLSRLCSSTATRDDHFMRDELIDEDVEFDLSELRRMLRQDEEGER